MIVTAAQAVCDLAALHHNFLQVRRQAPDAKIMAVVKANAYGHGLVRVAKTLREADAFAVARVDEGVFLRQAGVRQRIAVLEGFITREELDLHRQFRLDPIVHSHFQMDLLEAAANSEPLSVWLKLDTGMHRLGFSPEEYAFVRQRLNRCKGVARSVASMTHLSNADDLADAKTRRQLELFDRVTANTGVERSIANSAAILGWRQTRAEWVRPGIMLYGGSPFPGRVGSEHGLKPVMTFRSRLIAIKRIEPGETVGYGGEWLCRHSTRLGIAAVGYGDGYPRHAQAGTQVLVDGRRVPLVGRVSMDMMTLDLSDCPEARVGDPVTLWGDGLPVEEVAHHAATIPYTLLCAITQRVPIVENLADANSIVGTCQMMSGQAR